MIKHYKTLGKTSLLTFVITVLLVSDISAQFPGRDLPNVYDGHAAPTEHIRPCDALWVKTVWQRIPLREKMNQAMYLPESPDQNRMSLFDHLKEALLNEQTLVAYYPGLLGDNDMFDSVLSASQVRNMLESYDTVSTPSLLEDGVFIDQIVPNFIESRDIFSYEIKEQWILDKERSVLEPRIVGICPVQSIYDQETGEFRGYKKLFWIYYPDAKHTFATWNYYDRTNDTEAISYDDVFRKRYFSSYIVKVSNVYNRSLASYLGAEESLIQGEVEKRKIMNFEMDLWNY